MVNREGKISDAQRASLRAQRNASLTLLVVALVPAIVLLAAAIPVTLLLSGILALAVIRELWRAIYFQSVLSAGRITAHVGRVRLQAHNAQAHELYLETTHGVRLFHVSPEQKPGLRDGDYYVAYTAPRSDAILTIQPVDAGLASEFTRGDTVDLSALVAEESAVEKPKRDVFVLGDDGELELRQES